MLGLATGVAALGGGATVIAEAAGGGDGLDVTSLLGTTVTPVAVVLLLVTGWLRTKGEAERLAADLKAEREARAELQKRITDDVVPVLTRSIDVSKRMTDVLDQLASRQAGGG